MLFLIKDDQSKARAIEHINSVQVYEGMCVEVKAYKKHRSSAQNRLMWSWYTVIGKDVGQDPEDLHEEMKVRVLGVEYKMVSGQHLIVPKSSAKLSTRQMTEFLHSIEVLAMELNIKLPYPDDYNYIVDVRE